jgi:hypothetical protein
VERPVQNVEAAAWTRRTRELAHWTWGYVNRTDVWGGYTASGQVTRPPKKKRGQVFLTEDILVRHFAANRPLDIVGLHTTSPDNTSRWGAVDIDWHGETSTAADINERVAFAWFNKLAGLGFTPLLTTSNGAGGFHLRFLLSEPAPTARVFWFTRWLVKDHAQHGLAHRPETFPKQLAIAPGKYGNWLRLPGRHHKRNHWSNVWDGSRWLSCEQAVDYILSMRGSSPALIPADIELTHRIEAYLAKLPNLGEGQGRDDVAYNLLAFLARDLNLPDDRAIHWAEKWDAGNNPPKGRECLTAILANVHLHGQRAYGSGLSETPSRNGKAHLDEQGPSSLSEGGVCQEQLTFANHYKAPSGKKLVNVGLSAQEIHRQLQRLAGEWPRRVGKRLFVEGDDRKPLWLENTPELFAWIARQLPDVEDNPLKWARRGTGMVSEAEFHAFLGQTVDAYEAVEPYPHWPPMSGHFYLHPELKEGDGSALRELVERFDPATDVDHDLIVGFLLSLFWGGQPGQRPAWLFTSDDEAGDTGRGVGKSSVAKLGARLVGGSISASSNTPFDKLISRLLSPEALTLRVALLDNVKTLKFSWAELEGLITSDTISGHQYYVGEGRRPNTVTWAITLNGANLSTDLAQRCVIVKLKRPSYLATWEEDTTAFINAKRWAIIGDIMAALKKSTPALLRHSRWGAWEDAVLAKLGDPSECQKVIAERQGQVDDEKAEATLVQEYFAAELQRRVPPHNPLTDVVWIPSAEAAVIVNAATGKNRPVNRANIYLANLGIPTLRKSDRNGARGWAWTGEKSDGQPAVLIHPRW